jgi:hypothetical protein
MASAISLLQLSTLGAGYEALQLATLRPKIEIFELMPMGQESVIVVGGDAQELANYRKTIRTADLEKSVIIPEPHELLLKSFYHQNNSAVKDFLVIYESQFVGYLVELADQLLKRGFDVVDLRSPRFSGAWSSLIVTGAGPSEAETLFQETQSTKWKSTFVEAPTPELKKYFGV